MSWHRLTSRYREISIATPNPVQSPKSFFFHPDITLILRTLNVLNNTRMPLQYNSTVHSASLVSSSSHLLEAVLARAETPLRTPPRNPTHPSHLTRLTVGRVSRVSRIPFRRSELGNDGVLKLDYAPAGERKASFSQACATPGQLPGAY